MVLWSILFPSQSEDDEALLLALWERDAAGTLVEERGFRVFFPDTVDPAEIREVAQVPDQITLHADSETEIAIPCPDVDPILAGQRFFIVPPGSRAPTPEGRLRLEVSSSRGFGTGRHETTQMCLEALEELICPEAVVLDVGCGSGILSAAAMLLGARTVFSCDIQDDARRAAARAGSETFFAGSIDAVASGAVDLVLANITAKILDKLAWELKRAVKEDGWIVVSGFLEERPPESFRASKVLSKGDWQCWMCRAEGIQPGEITPPDGLSHEQQWWI